MPNGKIEARWGRRTGVALGPGAALLCALMPASAAGGPSSPEDRQRFVSVTHQLEQAPLDPDARADREWALAWLTEAPDVTVTVCADSLGGVVNSHYRYAGEIVLQDMFAMAALIIEHPETADDPNAQQAAGVEGALNAYRSIVRDKPDSRSPALEALLRTQARGELPDFIRKASIRCSAGK